MSDKVVYIVGVKIIVKNCFMYMQALVAGVAHYGPSVDSTVPLPLHVVSHLVSTVLTVLNQARLGSTISGSSTPDSSTNQILKLKLGPQDMIGTASNIIPLTVYNSKHVTLLYHHKDDPK